MTDLRRIYEPGAYAAASLDGCHWARTAPPVQAPALSGEVRAEFAVIGAGYAGLSAALHLARRGGDVVVLDLHGPGWGASGRNGGFCCLGGALLDTAALACRYGPDAARGFLSTERAAIDFVAARLEAEAIEADVHSRAGEVELAHSPRAMAALRDGAAGFAADFGVAPRLLTPADLRAEGMAAEGIHGGLHRPLGFALDPGKYVQGLARAVLAAGGRIHGESPVVRITPGTDAHILHTPGGQVRARHLLLATNGYSADNLPPWMAARVLPVLSSVMVTRPLTAAEIAAQGWTSDLMAYDSRRLLHYFRLMPDRRFLFGMRGGLRWTAAAEAGIRRRIVADFHAMFPAWTGVGVEAFWRGLVAFTRERVPYVGPIGDWPRAHAAFAWHGNGVAMASLCGDRLARRALGEPVDLPEFLSRPQRRFGAGRFRRALLGPLSLWYGLLDRL